MKMEIDSQELGYYQRIAVEEMNSISKSYEFYCKRAYDKANWWTKVKLLFKFPPSLRMYHVGEEVLAGYRLRFCLDIRETWHCFWWITNQMLRYEAETQWNDKVFLDGYETKQVLQIKKFYRKDYEAYKRNLE